MRHEYLIGYVYGLLETWELDLGILERTRFVWRWVLDTTYHEGRIDSGSSRMSDLLLIHHFFKRLICYVDVGKLHSYQTRHLWEPHVSEPHGMSWNCPNDASHMGYSPQTVQRQHGRTGDHKLQTIGLRMFQILTNRGFLQTPCAELSPSNSLPRWGRCFHGS